MEKSISVMLADSSESFRKLLGELIDAEEDMYVAGSADNGREAAELAVRLEPDVLITDLLLREMEGLSLIRQLKESGKLPYTILCSGFFNDYVAEMASGLGVVRFFPKPCRVSGLIESIRAAACGSREGDERTERERLRRSELERDIDEALLQSGVMPHLRGYTYLKAALMAAAENRELLVGVTKILYPELAERFGTGAGNFERCIRSAIEIAWRDGNRKKREEYFGREMWSSIAQKPGNTRYMKMVLERLDKQSK